MAKTINIYLNEKTKQYYLIMSSKHHVSLSAILDQLSFTYVQIIDKLKNEYLTKGTKTSIKEKSACLERYSSEEKMKIASNLLYLYAEKKTKLYIDENRDKYLRDKFNKFIQEKQDQWYDYNHFIRSQTRAMKNKKIRDYYKGLIAKYE